MRTPLKSISLLGRVTQGVTVMRLKGGDKIASFSVIVPEGEEEGLRPETSTRQPIPPMAPTTFQRKTITPAAERSRSQSAKTSFAKRTLSAAGLKEKVSKLAQKSKGFVTKRVNQTAREVGKSRLSKKRKR